MTCIIPEKNRRTVFDGIVQQSLDCIVSEGEVSHYIWCCRVYMYISFTPRNIIL